MVGLWIVVCRFDANGDHWTSGSILLWAACLQQGADPTPEGASKFGALFRLVPLSPDQAINSDRRGAVRICRH